MPKTESRILLESGTNELEVVEFTLCGEYYGINVAKVKEIIRADTEIVPIPDAHPSVIGVVNLRGRITPVVNLAKHLNLPSEFDQKSSRIIIAEFNKINVGFKVNTVTRIHRVSWKQVEPPSGLINSKTGYAVGIIKIDNRIVFLLDFEKVASVINPEHGLNTGMIKISSTEVKAGRSLKKILIAEDSPFISNILMECLTKSGYTVEVVINGLEAWQILEKIAQSPQFKKIGDYYNLLISDIEMPQMDGLSLVKKVKENLKLRQLPCIMFSSMISLEQSLKCKSVGSDAELTKPEIDRLVELVDVKAL